MNCIRDEFKSDMERQWNVRLTVGSSRLSALAALAGLIRNEKAIGRVAKFVHDGLNAFKCIPVFWPE